MAVSRTDEVVNQDLSTLPTPCALVDLERLEANCRAMVALARRFGVGLRPHVKTHKCLEAAGLQVAGAPGGEGIAVSTPAEARHFAEGGFRDITYAVPIAPERLPEAVEIGLGIDRLSVLVDGEVALKAAEEAAASARSMGVRVPVFLKIDCGYGRAGVDPNRPQATELARYLAESPHLEFRGLLTHGGHGYSSRSAVESRRVAEEEATVPATFARTLRSQGIEVPEVSVGSTPTCTAVGQKEDGFGISPGRAEADGKVQQGHTAALRREPTEGTWCSVVGIPQGPDPEDRPGEIPKPAKSETVTDSETASDSETWDEVTEIRPGNYAFFDAYQVAVGSCRLEDVAFTVLVTVISHHPHRNRLLVNAGSLALSMDPGARHVDPECGFGILADLQGHPLPGLHLSGLSQEHGWVTAVSGDGRELEAFPVGTRLRIYPNHSCLTAALYDRYHVLQWGKVVEEWRPVRGW